MRAVVWGREIREKGSQNNVEVAAYPGPLGLAAAGGGMRAPVGGAVGGGGGKVKVESTETCCLPAT